jgi:catechol 2,3-dioxygenase-like lactoylglutathione lyase family enzyme
MTFGARARPITEIDDQELADTGREPAWGTSLGLAGNEGGYSRAEPTEREASMLKNSPFYAGFAVDDLAKAKEFYGEKLGVFRVVDVGAGLLSLQATNGYAVLIYQKPGHEPAAHTILNFPVDDIEDAVDGLRKAGVEFEQYDEGPIKTNEKGIATPGPKQAWFRDPAGNILSVIEG